MATKAKKSKASAKKAIAKKAPAKKAVVKKKAAAKKAVKKTAAKKAVKAPVKKAAVTTSGGLVTRVRMYNQQDLGDCFLLQFEKGGKSSWIWIDFGSYTNGNAAREKVIAKHIKDTVGTDDLRIVVTHQHKDHISGFANAYSEIKDIPLKELWLSFLDDEESEAGQALRSTLESYWNKNAKLNGLAAKVLGVHAPVKKMLKAKQALDLFAEQQTGGAAYKNLHAMAGNNIKFFEPGHNFGLDGFEEEVKVYVLGPPVDSKQMTSMNPRKGEDVDGLMLGLGADLALANDLNATTDFLLNALDGLDNGTGPGTLNFPFEEKYYIRVTDEMRKPVSGTPRPMDGYFEAGKQWRQIECDWLKDMGKLALHMDNLTNNTSLVLAFELVKAQKVLLFVGDAQIGNWRSWFDVKFKDSTVTAEDLLKRTVLYKAGHHSSHNATYRKGLDLMNEKELVIMVPLNQAVSDKSGFLMGKPPMIQGYNRKAHGRVVRTDTIYQSPKGMGKLQYTFANKINGVSVYPKGAANNQLYIEYEVQ